MEPKNDLYKTISHFGGLNALRFFAALLVVLHHSETIKKKHGLVDFEWLGLFRNGPTAVTFFFVLSGFLITYILLREDYTTGKTRVGAFYLKRVLRIWPLYFLLVFIGTVLLPLAFGILNIDYQMPYTLAQTWGYFVLFLPGLVTFYYGHHFLEPLWSIGVEEHFYLIWAPLFKLLKKHLPYLLLGIVTLVTALQVADQTFVHNDLFRYLLSTFRFDAMAIGGLGAYFLYHTRKPLGQQRLFSKPVQVALFVLCGVFILFNANIHFALWDVFFKAPIVSRFVVNLLFLYVILTVSVAENSLFRPKSKVLDYLGEISYGIYMYHMLAIFASIQFAKGFLLRMDVVAGQVLYYLLIVSLTVAVAAISKKFFEDVFLKWKTKLDKPTKAPKTAPETALSNK